MNDIIIPTNRNSPKKKPNKASAIPESIVAIVHMIKNVNMPLPFALTNNHAIIKPKTNASISILKSSPTVGVSELMLSHSHSTLSFNIFLTQL